MTPHLLFELGSSLYAVEAPSVREVFQFPELKPLAEGPRYVLGVLNLRGRIVPVMDLQARLGRPPRRYGVHDHVIALERQGLVAGVVVSEVRDVRLLPQGEEIAGRRRARFVDRVVSLEDEILMVLDLDSLLQLGEALPEPETGEEDAQDGPGEPPEELEAAEGPGGTEAAELTPAERAVLRERARGLMQAPEQHDLSGFVPLAVVRLGEEFFGVHLTSLREFCQIRGVTPVPCCPEHVLGAVNLRGEVLTVVDIRKALRMPIGQERERLAIMVVQVGEIRAGVVVDEILDVVYYRPRDLNTVPAAVRTGSEEYLESTAPYGGRMLGVIDMPRVFSTGELVVREEV